MRLAVLLSLATACGDRAEPTSARQPRPQPGSALGDAGASSALITAPHAKAVATVAVTDDAKAAITSDELGELRFWPTLDGLHEPVAIRARTPTRLALAPASDGYVAALLDTAGGVELVRLGADGAVRDRRVIAAEPGFAEVAAAGTAIIARRSDQMIVRLDVPAQPLAPQIGERILAIAARRNIAVAALADPEHVAEVRQVRQIALAHDLAWGAAYTLPVPLKAPIAVSPSGGRIAGIDARSGAATIVELSGQPRVIASDGDGAGDGDGGDDDDDDLIGFLDDERAVFRGGVVVGVRVPPSVPVDPWAVSPAGTRLRIGRDPMVTDGRVVSGHGTNLMLAAPGTTQFLGYRDLGTGYLRVTPNATTLNLGSRLLWLDDELHDLRARDIVNDASGGLTIDDHRLLKGTYTFLEDDLGKLDVALVDAATGLEVQLGTWERASSLAYDPDTRVLAVAGYSTTIRRVLLDADAAKVTPLRSLKVRRESGVELFDPAVANGLIAIATSYEDGEILHETFIDDGKQTAKPLAAARRTKLLNAVSLGFDRDGTIYALQMRGDAATHVVVYRGGKEARRWPVGEGVSAGAVDRAGTQIATFTATALIVTDAEGRERWRRPVWEVNAVRFTADGRRLIVNTGGGLVALDAATGAPLATACGWGFGLSTTEPSISEYNVPVVCAEAS